jgi:hypothetical protein
MTNRNQHRSPYWAMTLLVGLLPLVGCSTKSSQPSSLPAKRTLADIKKPKDLAEQVSLTGVDGAMRAARAEIDQEKRKTITTLQALDGETVEPQVKEYPSEVQILGARSLKPYRQDNLAEAERDAVLEAQRALAENLGGLVIPVEAISITQKDYEAGSEENIKLWKANNVESDRGWISINARVTSESIREARAKSRISTVGLFGGGAFALVLLGYLFLRIDNATKGYLTWVLGGVLVAIVGGAAVFVLRSGWVVW